MTGIGGIIRKPKEPKFTAAVLISSDRCYSGERSDQTGPRLKRRLAKLGFEVVHVEIIPDDTEKITAILKSWVSSERIDLILTSGGTGLSPSDVTPEATLAVIERRVPGMEEAMRQASLRSTAYAMLSRAVVGAVGQSLIVNLPGNPDGALENLRTIEPALQHALRLLRGENPHK